jgi:DNA-directed RNA polymerase specialized sigma24 family protein
MVCQHVIGLRLAGPCIAGGRPSRCDMSEMCRAVNEIDGYDLFRLAIVDQNADAWAECVARYRPLLIAWANTSSSAALGERCDDIADEAFARAWSALTPGRFVGFPGLPPLLAYLRSCVAAVVVDGLRAQQARQRRMQRMEISPVLTPEQVVLDQAEHTELWRIAQSTARTLQEQAILFDHFVLDLPPREIRQRHPELFENVDAVYKIKRNLVGRLQRSPEIQRLYLDGLAA